MTPDAGVSQRPRLRRVAVRVGLLVLGLVLSLAMAEIALRLRERSSRDPRSFEERLLARVVNSRVVATSADRAHPRFGYTLTPNETTTVAEPVPYEVSTNSLGFRAPEPAPESDSGSDSALESGPGAGSGPGAPAGSAISAESKVRVLLLGDSMLFGVGVAADETVGGQLERIAREQGTAVEAHNYALMGYNTVQARAVGREMIPRLTPDHVVLSLFIGNDPIANSLVTEEPLYRADDDAIARLRRELRGSLPLEGRSALGRMFALGPGGPRLRYRVARRAEVVARTVDIVTDLATFAREHDGRFTLLLLPTIDALRGGAAAAWSGSSRAVAVYRDELRRADVDVVVLDASNGHARGLDAAFFPLDRHPNASGNRWIADSLWTSLQQPQGPLAGDGAAGG